MCGIAGILRVYPPGVTPPPHFESIPEAWLDLLDDSIKHRGPDGQGRFRDRAIRADGCTVDVALVHRRLSILDHTGGAQPMVSAFGSPSGLSPSAGPEGVASIRRPLQDRAGGGVSLTDSTLPLLFQGSPTAAVRYEPIATASGASFLGTPTLRVKSSLLSSADAPSHDLLAVTFNGCIYNHRELRKELEAKGHHFVTDHSDTEVLLHGWREWGEKLTDHLDGMYAFATWDRSAGSLLLARDTFGEKPLYMHHVANGDSWINAFGSVPPHASGLLASLGQTHIPHPRRSGVDDWLRFGWSTDAPIDGATSISSNEAWLYRPASSVLPPSTTVAEMAQRVAPESLPRGDKAVHYHGHYSRRTNNLSAESLDDLIARAVESRLESDVPLGCFLSGGVDSSLVAVHAKRRLGRLSTFTVRMPDAAYDESHHAKAAAIAIGTNHFEIPCEAKPATDLVHLIERLGLPFGDSSMLPAYWVSRAARSHVAVALSGDGGDELFAGYERYSSVTVMPLLGWLGSLVTAPIRYRAHPRSTREKVARFFDASGGLGYWDIISIFPGAMLDRLIPQWPERDSRPWYRKNQIHLEALKIAFDLNNYLPEDILRKTDTASMHVALEVRCPFLAKELVAAAESATLRSLKPRGQRKGLLRAVARKYLPKEIVDRPKMGFAIPVGEWFRSDFGQMKTLLMDMLHSADPFPADLLGLELNRRFIDQMLAEHMESRRDHSQRLYMLLVLSIWCRWLRRIRNDACGVSSSGS